MKSAPIDIFSLKASQAGSIKGHMFYLNTNALNSEFGSFTSFLTLFVEIVCCYPEKLLLNRVSSTTTELTSVYVGTSSKFRQKTRVSGCVTVAECSTTMSQSKVVCVHHASII